MQVHATTDRVTEGFETYRNIKIIYRKSSKFFPNECGSSWISKNKIYNNKKAGELFYAFAACISFFGWVCINLTVKINHKTWPICWALNEKFKTTEMRVMVLWSGLCLLYCHGWGGKCSEILAMIKLLYKSEGK